MHLQKLHNLGQQQEYFDEFLKVNEHLQEMRIVIFFRDIYTSGNMEKLTNDVFGKEYAKSINEALLESIDANKFLEYLKKTENKYYSFLKINHLLYYFISNEINREQFHDLKNEVFNTVRKIEKWQAYTILTRLNELVLLKLIPADPGYNKDFFELSKLFCELNIFTSQSEYSLPIGDFRDIFIPALNLKEYDWAENFVNEYSKFLNEDIRENELNYCSGILNFKRGRYKKSLEFFSKLKPDDIMVKLNVRFYYIMNYIELKAYESARSALHAFRQFYKDNTEIPEIKYKLIPDALKYFSEIIKCEEENKKFDEFLYKEANDGRKFYHAIYILEKMEKLK